MKKIIVTGFLFAVLSTFSSSLLAQTFGHVNMAEIVKDMPEMKAAQDSMQTAQMNVQTTLEEWQAELQRMEGEFEKNSTTWTDAFKQQQMQIYQQMAQRAQVYQQEETQKLQVLQQDLLTPVIEKAKNAIEKVAQAKKLTYVFNYDEQASMLLYASPTSTDISPAVKKELGILK